jgi:hypothetical protein
MLIIEDQEGRLLHVESMMSIEMDTSERRLVMISGDHKFCLWSGPEKELQGKLRQIKRLFKATEGITVYSLSEDR